MAIRKAYTRFIKPRGMHSDLKKVLLYITLLISSLISNTYPILAQEQTDYDEISVYLAIPGVGAGEISAVIKNEDLYLPIIDLFDFLKIKNIPSYGLETISGFFINPDATYSISKTDNRIVYENKTYNLEAGDLVKTETNLYLKLKYFNDVFGLECKFSFRNLSVTITSKFDLPVVREMQREEMRRNLSRLKGDFKADTTIARTRPLLKFGMADWAINASEEIGGKTETSINMALGAMVAGGEATASIYYDSREPFNEKDQLYLWKYVNNDFSPLRQVMLGKINSNAVSTLFNPVIGVSITNTPTTYRRSFGSFTLSDKTEPGWIVELYVNNVLVDYMKADASGFYTFQVPLVYGNSEVQLKFYGPWGEERIKEQNINIPFTFLPVNTLEYTISAGIVEDTLRSRFSRASFNYGVSRRLTMGGGVEYLSRLVSTPSMPFLNASFGITNNLLISGEYTLGVRARGNLSYRLPSNLQLDLYYTWYDRDQKAINFNYLEERKATLSAPLKIGKFSAFQRFSIYQIALPYSSFTSAEWLFSGSFLGASTNLTTSAMFTDESKPAIFSNLSFAFRFPWGIVVMPQAQYHFNLNRFVTAKIRLEKHLMENAYLNLSYEHIFYNNIHLAEIGFRYDFSFAQTGASIQQYGDKTTFYEYARGSLINDSKTKYLGTGNRSNVGKGGISIIPFIDFNANGKKDPGEPKAPGLNLRANGGRVERSEQDTIIRILGLEPYTSCFIELDPSSFEDVTWRIQKKTLSVMVDPNILKTIEIPIIAAGEANGYVTLEKDGETKGQGRIIVNIITDKNRSVNRSITEDDGFYSYFGLTPGKYVAMVDTNQLKKLRMTSEPGSISFEIKGGIDGDIVEGLDFLLRIKPADTTALPEKPVAAVVAQKQQGARKDTTYMIVHEVTQVLQESTEDSFAVQLGAFKKKANADAMRRKLEKVLGRPLEIVVADGFYKVRIPQMKDREEVDATINILGRNGVTELWVISMRAKQQQWVLTERQDTITNIKEFLPDTAAADLTPYMSIQLGAFRRQANALALRDKFAAMTNKKVVIVREDGLYKVRITGFSSYEEMEKLLPSFGKDVWKMPIQLPAGAPVEERRLEFRKDSVAGEKPLAVPDTARKELPVIVPDTTQLVIPVDTARVEVEIAVKVDTAIVEPDRERDVPVEDQNLNLTEPTISLHAAVFNKESQAQRAVSKIQSKLNLPAVIVQQWDSYHVVIPGFFTREETYKYYPELAGLGFTEVYIIEKK